MLIDTHVHLNDNRLYDESDDIINDFKKDNLYAVINVGYDKTSSQRSIQLANKHNDVYAAVGVHPHDAKKWTNADFDFFKDLAKSPKCVAYGEIGLDFHYDFSPQDIQKTVFLEQLEFANSLHLPVIIHLREAYAQMLTLLRDNKHYLKNGAVMHCYMGSKEMVKEFSRFEPMYFAFGGAITFNNANKEDVIKAVPKDRLLLETDCPYMTPVPFRGKLNYPKYVSYVKDKIQSFISNEDIEILTTNNAKVLFNIK